jgi:hypothetical protein
MKLSCKRARILLTIKSAITSEEEIGAINHVMSCTSCIDWYKGKVKTELLKRSLEDQDFISNDDH